MAYSKSKDSQNLCKPLLKVPTKHPFYYHHSSHATYNLTGHLVWITKYRRKVLTEPIIERLKVIIT